LEPCRLEVVSSNTGRGYVSNLVTEFRARKSTQTLIFGLPSSIFFGTKMAGAAHGEVDSRPNHAFI